MMTIICDLDGTLVDTEGLMRTATKRAFERYGAKPTKSLMIKFLGQGSKAYVRNIAAEFSLTKYTKELLDERIAQYFVVAKGKLKAYKGVKSFLREVKKERYTLALATSGTRKKALFSLREAGIDRRMFKTITTADEVKKAKPDPQIYKKTARKLGVRPKDCIVFEDSLAGVISAKQAGMRVVAVSNSFSQSRLNKVHPDLMVSNINDAKVWQFIRNSVR